MILNPWAEIASLEEDKRELLQALRDKDSQIFSHVAERAGVEQRLRNEIQKLESTTKTWESRANDLILQRQMIEQQERHLTDEAARWKDQAEAALTVAENERARAERAEARIVELTDRIIDMKQKGFEAAPPRGMQERKAEALPEKVREALLALGDAEEGLEDKARHWLQLGADPERVASMLIEGGAVPT